MKLHILESGSKANGYVIENENEALIIEAGVPVERVVKALNYKNIVCGVLVTHEHGDHSQYAGLYSSRFPLFATSGTLQALSISNGKVLEYETSYKIGNFTVLPFATKHDAVEPCGFLIYHKECGNILFATDTYLIPVEVVGLNHLIMECNYCEQLLEDNFVNDKIDKTQYLRVIQSHMALETCVKYVELYKKNTIDNIILIHGSSRNSDRQLITKSFQERTGYTPIFAESDKIVNIDKIPF